VLWDNSSAYLSKPWRQALVAWDLICECTRPYTPHVNGKADRFIKTLLSEWAYAMIRSAQLSATVG